MSERENTVRVVVLVDHYDGHQVRRVFHLNERFILAIAPVTDSASTAKGIKCRIFTLNNGVYDVIELPPERAFWAE